MKFSTAIVDITPNFPIKQAGFIQQTKPIKTVHDKLKARILSFYDNEKYLFLISCDNLGFPISLQKTIESNCEKYFKLPCTVILSSTHTHFGADPDDNKYLEFCKELLVNACRSLEFTNEQLNISYTYKPFSLVGKSRVSNHESNVILQVISINNKRRCLAKLIIYNCHPTIMNPDNVFFSAEYPGYILNELGKQHQDVFFTFMQGADGDISTRFTRTGQNYQALEKLANTLVSEINKMDTTKIYQFNDFSIIKNNINIKHDLNSLDLDYIPDNISDREKETIEYGKQVREYLLSNPQLLHNNVLISCVKLGKIKLIFAPNELFSSYLNSINLDDTVLVCYSNGYGPYVTGINDNFITYEKFTDTWSKESKLELLSVLKQF